MADELDPVETEIIDGKLTWIFPDGTTHPVIRGGSEDDDSEDDGEDDTDDEELDEDDEDSSDDEDSEDEDDDDEDEDDGDEPEFATLGDVESMIDRRINRLTRTLRDEIADLFDDDSGSSRRRGGKRTQRKPDPDFSDREARLVGTEIIRDDLPRMSDAEREVARGLLANSITKHKASGDSEEAVGELAAQEVIRAIKKLRGEQKSSSSRTAKKRGAGAPPQRKKTPVRKSAGSDMQKGAARAAARRPRKNTETGSST